MDRSCRLVVFSGIVKDESIKGEIGLLSSDVEVIVPVTGMLYSKHCYSQKRT